MNVARSITFPTLCSCLLLTAGVVRAQGPYVDSDSSMASIAETSYQDIMSRLSSLEASMDSVGDGKQAGSGWKEVDVTGKPTMKWFGRVNFDYWPMPDNSSLPNALETGDPNVGPSDMVGFRRLRIGVKGKVWENMEYKIQLDFADPAKLKFKDAYLGWTKLPFLQTVLLGNQKRPYGLDHLNSSRYNVFMERPLVVEALNQDSRRLGIASYGVSQDKRWNWRYGYYLMDDLSGVGHQYRDGYQSELAGRLANTIWYDEASGGRGYAHWAISGSAAFPGGGPDGRFRTRPEGRTRGKWLDTGSANAVAFNNYFLGGLEGVVNVGAFSLVGELMGTHVDRTNQNAVDFGGGYVYTAYWLTGESTPWNRSRGTISRTKPLENFFLVRDRNGDVARGWGAWQIAGRYSYGDFTNSNVFGGVGENFTLGLNWWWNSNARVQFNYINGRISERAIAAVPQTEGWYNIFGARFMCDF